MIRLTRKGADWDLPWTSKGTSFNLINRTLTYKPGKQRKVRSLALQETLNNIWITNWQGLDQMLAIILQAVQREGQKHKVVDGRHQANESRHWWVDHSPKSHLVNQQARGAKCHSTLLWRRRIGRRRGALLETIIALIQLSSHWNQLWPTPIKWTLSMMMKELQSKTSSLHPN